MPYDSSRKGAIDLRELGILDNLPNSARISISSLAALAARAAGESGPLSTGDVVGDALATTGALATSAMVRK